MLGITSPETPQVTQPPPSNASYPSQEDALDAIKNGYGYGTGHEPYIEGKRAEIYKDATTGSLSDAIAAPSKNTDLTKLSNIGELDKVKTLFAQGALAANRSPIATLGFEPAKAALQTKLGKANVAGAFSKDQDRIFVNVDGDREEAPSTIVHESIHRGLEELRKKSPEARELMRDLPREELLVRYIMAKTMGDPEHGTGDVADQQRKSALYEWDNNSFIYNKAFKRLETIAAELHKDRRPGGPR
jgi:hypothetical protein